MNMFTCSACLNTYDKDAFSRNQLNNRNRRVRRCRECILRHIFPTDAIDYILYILSLPRDVRRRLLEFCKKESPLPAVLLGIMVSVDATAEFCGVDARDIILSPQFADTLRIYQDTFVPYEAIQKEVERLLRKNRDLRIELMVEREIHQSTIEAVAQKLEYTYNLRLDRDDPSNISKIEGIEWQERCEEQLLVSEHFFETNSKFCDAIFSLSRRGDEVVFEPQPLPPYGEDNNPSGPDWQRTLIQRARNHVLSHLPWRRRVYPFFAVREIQISSSWRYAQSYMNRHYREFVISMSRVRSPGRDTHIVDV